LAKLGALNMDFKLPKLGEGADSGVVVNLFVKEGDTVAKDQTVLELESEKAVASIPSSVAGTVTKIHVKAGDKISVGARIFSVGEAGASAAPASPAAAAPAVAPAAADAPASGAPVTAPVGAYTPLPASGAAPVASPSLRKVIADLGIDAARVRGTGRGGRIELGDLKNYLAYLQQVAFGPKPGETAAPAKPAVEQIDFSKWGPVLKKPMTSLRKTIARRMVENWNAIPHVTQFDEVDITALLALRKQYAAEYEKRGAKLTVTALILKGVADALRKHPLLNSSMDEVTDEVVIKEYIHLGIAVDTEAGLLVPVLRDVNKKSVFQLSKELEELGAKARDRKVTPDDLRGGSFTISNLGAIGGGHFTPIINKPEVAILGLGRGMAKPVVREGKIESRTLMPISVSYDHRIIDGGNAARFVVDLLAAIEALGEADVKL
jgi:pyruvate dehydrogenase E2 component (dihydrolipoamide acetyltransferase)